MMRTRQFIAIFLLVGGLFTINNPLWAQANAQPNQADVELVIWTYDSFMSEWGPAGQIAEAFQKPTAQNCALYPRGWRRTSFGPSGRFKEAQCRYHHRA